VDGKPGVPAMQHMCNTFLKAPDILHHLLVKLLHDELFASEDTPTTRSVRDVIGVSSPATTR
jgi:hypothetical protein